MHNGLAKQERIYLKEEINALFAGKKSFVSYPIRVVYTLLPSEESAVRILISVPKRLHKHAVARNRIKRLYRECYRVNKHELVDQVHALQKGTLLVGMIYLSDEICTYPQALKSTQSALDKLLKRLQQAPQEMATSTSTDGDKHPKRLQDGE